MQWVGADSMSDINQPTAPTASTMAECPHCGAMLDGVGSPTPGHVLFQVICPACEQSWLELHRPDLVTRCYLPVSPTA
jgi:hypothetical protein